MKSHWKPASCSRLCLGRPQPTFRASQTVAHRPAVTVFGAKTAIESSVELLTATLNAATQGNKEADVSDLAAADSPFVSVHIKETKSPDIPPVSEGIIADQELTFKISAENATDGIVPPLCIYWDSAPS